MPTTISGTATSFITFSRASTATRVNASGIIESVAANTPRLDYDPVTLAPRGLLVEEQRTNLLLNSDTLSTQSVTVSAVAYTLSFWGTGTVTLSGTSTAGPLVGTGANNRVTLTFTPTAGTLTLTVTGTVTQAQLEAGSFATSYIPTTTASATRSADVASVATSAFPYNETEGTIVLSHDFLEGQTVNANRGYPGSLLEPSTKAIIAYYADGRLITQVPSTVVGPTMGLTTSPSKLGTAFDTSSQSISKDGGAVSTGNVSLSLSSSSVLNMTGFFGIAVYSGHIRQITYIPRRLTNAELQARTA